jgi:ABC-type sugar transport system ATPase subunit
MCDRLAVMSRGRLSKARPIEDWTPESVMQAAIGTGEGSLKNGRNDPRKVTK